MCGSTLSMLQAPLHCHLLPVPDRHPGPTLQDCGSPVANHSSVGQPTEQARQTQEKAKVGLWGGGERREEMGEKGRGGDGRERENTEEDGDRERGTVLGGDKSALK